jgi:hypothetical protein
MKKTLCVRFSDKEFKYIKSAVGRGDVGPNAYLERLVQEDMRNGEADALLALSVKDICDAQAEQYEQLKQFQTHFISELSEINALTKSQHAAIEQSYEALTVLAEITDANNTVLENVERNSKKIIAFVQH